MAAGQSGFEGENKHATGPELRARRWLRFWKPPTTWGGGRGLAAAAMKPALLLRRRECCLTRDYLSAAPGIAIRREHAPQHDRRKFPFSHHGFRSCGSSEKGEGEERRTGIALDSPGPCGRKDSRSHGINHDQITVSLRQLRRRRGLLRLRCWRRTEALERMCKGRGGNGTLP